jgi:hypothetical protein
MKERKFVSLVALLFLPGVIILSGILTFTGCKKTTAAVEFQGPQNSGFEEAGNSTYGFSAANWTSSYLGINCYGTKRLGGTGFMPTKGSWYMKVGACPFSGGSGLRTEETSQEFVNFNHSTTMIFDYSVVGSNISAGGIGKVEILFTSNGTVTLWSKTYAASTTPSTQQLNERVTLPSLPDKGKLIIRITYNLGTPASVMTFEIDNIRVE